jgi:hypothetical protein
MEIGDRIQVAFVEGTITSLRRVSRRDTSIVIGIEDSDGEVWAAVRIQNADVVLAGGQDADVVLAAGQDAQEVYDREIAKGASEQDAASVARELLRSERGWGQPEPGSPLWPVDRTGDLKLVR